MFCAKCGTEVAEEHTFCMRCGNPVPQTSSPLEPPFPPEPEPASAPPPASRRSLIARGLRTLMPIVVTLGVIGGFMAADRLTLHWYVPEDTSASVSSLESDVAGLKTDASSLQTRVSGINSNLSSLTSRVSNLGSGSGPDIDAVTRDARIANALTVISLINNYGGIQRSDSPAGEACFGWLMFGDGSVTDCGFTR